MIRENGRLGLLYVLALLCAIVVALVLHEIAHGLVALWNGDPTAKMYGRLSLNPLKHFDLFGLLMMLIGASDGQSLCLWIPATSKNTKPVACQFPLPVY